MPLNIDTITHDLTITAGSFDTVSDLTAVAQRIRDRLYTFTLEWFLDQSFGVPYLDQILGQANPNVATIAAILKREARKSLAGEAVLTALLVKFESDTRELKVSMLITAPDGAEISDNFIL